MKVKLLILSIVFFSFSAQISAQNLVYKTFNSSDIRCAKLIYKRVYNDNYKNYPLFYPENSNLINLLVDGILNDKITPYYPFSSNFGNEFTEIFDKNKILKRLGQTTESQAVKDENDKYSIQDIVIPYDENDIESYMMLELWFYGFNDCVIQKITIGICPIRTYYEEWDDKKESPLYKQAFWVYFPDIQDYLSTKIATEKSGKKTRTFEEILFYQDYEGVELSDKIEFEYYYNERDKDIPEFNEEFTNLYINLNNFTFTGEQLPGLIQEDSNIKPNKNKTIDEEILSAQIIYKRVWKNDTLNSALFYPEYPKLGFLNFIDLIMQTAKDDKKQTYNASGVDIGTEFNYPISLEELEEKMGKKIFEQIEEDGDILKTINIEHSYFYDEITSYLIQEVQFFNKNKEVVQTRVNGICPIRQFFRENDYEQTQPLYRKVGWIYYPDFQEVAVNQNIYNTTCYDNSTFDDFIFNKSYKAENLADTSTWTKYGFDSEIAKEYQNLFLNIHSNDTLITKFLINNIKPVKINIDNYAKIGKKDFKKAEIIYSEFNRKDNENLFIPESFKPELGFKKLSDIIIDELYNSGNFYTDEKFKKTFTVEQVKKLLGFKIDSIIVENFDSNDTIAVETPYNLDEITSYKLKELWLYDKEGDIIDKRILAICPVRTIPAINGQKSTKSQLFWINFPEFIDVFKNHYVTQKNLEMPINYNNYFIENKYNSTVIKKKKISKGKANKYLKLY